ncbi:hypothetical protein WMY93_022552 [Mugilogobius chulae]|uniref:Thioredoxin domain containing 16 n=1 Tax=Mugilogobius chulae TaxID=88201 RepID=A0AAW0N7A3_9GOBI
MTFIRGHPIIYNVNWAVYFYEKLYTGKTMFMYFQHEVSPSIFLFLGELEKAADVLQDYGVLVGKVNCNKEIVSKYCLEDKISLTAFLFRNSKEFLSFDLDTVFDVNAIVSECILRDEVRYVHTDADLLAMEKSVKGIKDIVLGYVSSLGTQEHRSIMETAFVYGSKYQFILITGGPVLKHLGPFKKPTIPVQPQERSSSLLFSLPETEDVDKETAHRLAWKLRGIAQVVLVHRENLAVQTLKQHNAAYRLPGKSLEYLTLHSIEEILDLFTKKNRKNQLDDEVAASVYLKRGKELDMDVFTELNAQNFHSVVAQSRLTVALFYLKWDAVSMAFLEPFVEVAESLLDADIEDVQMCAVNCGEWTDLCAAQSANRTFPFQPITAFPTVLLLRPQEPAQFYKGISQVKHCTALFYCVSVFVEAARAMRGELLTGLLTDGLALKWASDHKADLPCVLVFPSWQADHYPSVFPLASSADELVDRINTALLQPVPELTVTNLPTFLSLGRALLLLFVGEEEDEIGQKQNKALVDELKRVVVMGGTQMEKYLPCWIHLGRTPAGIDVLGSYLGSVPPLPSLILTHNPSAAEIYQYPPRQPITAASVLQWVRRVEEGREQAAGVLGEENWPPVAPFYDFLVVMDKNDPSFARQQQPKQEMREKEEDETREKDGEVNSADEVTVEGETLSKILLQDQINTLNFDLWILCLN